MGQLYLQLILIIFVYMCSLFVIAQRLKNNGIVDIGWPFGYVIIAVSSLLITQQFTVTTILTTLLISLWGVRLGVYLWIRAYRKPEDFRYANFRKQWGKNVVIISFFRVFMLQGTIMLVIAYPLVVSAVNGVSNEITLFSILGLLVWIIGYFFQVVGDTQLATFKKQRQSKEDVLQTGLWAYTRHPNYFGEATMWWGLALIVLPLQQGYIALITAFIMNVFLVKISGVPFLDRRYANNMTYQQYKKQTNRFIPWFPKQIK